MSAPASGQGALNFLAGGGEMGERMRTFAWDQTALGPAASWPQSLKTAVRIMLTSRQPIWIGWGRELTYLYNDAYHSIIGGKHPWALGRPTREVWSEIWTDIGPLLATAMGGVEGTYVEEQLLIMERNGYPEETYYTFSYSPIPDDDGAAGGIICANSDDTQRVIGERQLGLLRELAAGTVNTRSWREAAERSVAALQSDARDLTFALLYLREPDGDALTLAGVTGLPAAHGAAPSSLSPTSATPWPVAEAMLTGEIQIIDDLDARLSEPLPAAPWEKASRAAAVLPIVASGETGRSGVLIVGLNPYRLFNDGYAGFLRLAAGQIAGAIASADAYEQERRRSEALAELDRAKTAFFSNVSHEFRTPLTLMLGPLEDVLSGEVPADQIRPQIELAHRNGARLMRLVNSLLDFSRIEAGRVQATFQPTDLSNYSCEIASTFRSAIEKAGMALVLDCQPLPQPAYLDRDMWEKVLLNLLSNAFKFTMEGQITLSVAASDDGRAALVKVSDTGVGVPPAELPRLFERFHRVEGQQSRSFEGSGIGLALVQELMKLHGGDITAQSREGAGTTFTLRLPLGHAHLPADQVREGAPIDPNSGARAHEYVEEALRWSPSPSKATGSVMDLMSPPAQAAGEARRRIVLADDNADMREYVQRLLAGRWDVETVGDGQEALEAIRARTPDLVLTDVMMPRLDGFGLLAAIRQDETLRELPVILLSARAGEDARIEGLGAGADDYLTKPFSARELIARVGSNLELARIRREAKAAIEEREAKLQQQTAQFKTLLGQAPLGVYLVDAALRIREINPTARPVFGDIPNLIGRDFGEVVHILWPQDYADEVVARFRHTLDTGESYHEPERVEARLDLGVTEYYEWMIDRMPMAEGGFGVVCYFRDISVQVLARQTIAKSEERLRELNSSLEDRVAREVAERAKTEEALRQAQKMEAVGQLTGGVAHDFNNLLTVIIGGLDTIRRSKPDDEARRTRALDMALQGAQRAASLTERLLAFSRRQPLAPKPLELNLVVRDMTELLYRTLGEEIELEGVLAPRLWAIEADQNQLESAILNLAVNARDAMPAGGKLTLETANTYLDESYASVDAEVIPGQYVAISVSDTGSGMSKETVARVFEPFFTTKEVGRGTGLGLSMVYGFVKQSGGHVTIYSEEGQGTTVKLYFPRRHGAVEVLASAEVAPTPPASDGEIILVVEDNDDVRAYSIMILKELGYGVIEAVDAVSGLEQIRADQRIDLLFTDVVLPGQSGRVLADAAAEARPALKVLFTTGYSRNAIVHQGRLDAGVQLISKPFTFDQLATRVRDVLDHRN